MRAGGVLVAIGGAATWAQKHELSAVKVRGSRRNRPPMPKARSRPPRKPWPTARSTCRGRRFSTQLRPGSLLTVGLEDAPPVLFSGTSVLLPTGQPQVDLWTVAPRNEVIAGLVWPEAAERLRGALSCCRARPRGGARSSFSPRIRPSGASGAAPCRCCSTPSSYEPNRHGLASR
jgi:hypothetical protein